MSAGMLTTIRFAAALAALLMAVIGALWALDVVGGATAAETLGRMLVVVAILTVASLAVMALSRPKRPGRAEDPR